MTKINGRMKKNVIQSLACGESQREISKKIGVTQAAISKFANKEGIKPLVEKEIEKLYEILPDIVEQLKRDIATADRISKAIAGDLPEEETRELTDRFGCISGALRFKESIYKQKSDVLKALGVYPSQAPSIAIQNIYQQETNEIFLEPVVQKVLNLKVDELVNYDKPENNETENKEVE